MTSSPTRQQPSRRPLRRSWPPCFAAILTGSQPWDDYCGPGSPLERFVELEGRVLRLGADPDTVTLFHYAEYLADVPGKRRVVRHRKVMERGEPVIRTVHALDDSHGIVEYPGADYFTEILDAFLATGRVRTSTVGGAVSELIDARPLAEFAIRWMEQHLAA